MNPIGLKIRASYKEIEEKQEMHLAMLPQTVLHGITFVILCTTNIHQKMNECILLTLYF